MVRVIRQVASAFPHNLASLNELINGTEEAVVIFEPALKIAEPVSALLTDFEREYFTVLAIPENDSGDTTVAHQRLLAVQTLDHQITTATHQLIPAIYIPSTKLKIVRTLISELEKFPNSQIDPIQYLILGLVRLGEQIRVLEIDSLPPVNSDPDKLRLQLANRSNDGFFSTFILRKISKVFTRAALNLKLKPNFVTVISFLVGVFAAIEFSRSNYISGAVLLQLSLILDCVDGEVARYTKQFSRFGAWLDALSDRVKEFMAIGGLAYSVQDSVENIWILATIAVIIQTVKHISDYDFTAVRESLEVRISPIPLNQKTDGLTKRKSLKKGGATYWVKKVIYFPIAERWLLISVGAVAFGPELTLIALIVLGFLSLSYVKLGRVLRSYKWGDKINNCDFIDQQGDLGFNLKFSNFRFGWGLSSVLRLIEFVLIVAIFSFDFSSNLFLLIFVIAIYHYVNLYDSLNIIPPTQRFLGLYLPGRLLLILIVVISLGAQSPAISWLCAYLGLVIIWRGGRRLSARGN